MIAETDIRLPPDAYDDPTERTSHLAHQLGVAASAITHHVVVRRSLDARKGTPVYMLRVRVWIDEPFRPEPAPPLALRDVRGALPAVVVGAGPAGLFAALTLIERGAPVTIEVGETVEGIKLLRADRASAVLSIDGITKTLPLVADSASVGDPAGSGTVTLLADAGGQFFTSGTVNGRSVRFVVDTGATLTTLSRADAQRIGLDYRGGKPTRTTTANGVVNGWRMSLDSVRVGDTTVRDVDAMVVDNDTLPVGLLGMSFLGRFDMHRQGSTLVLRRRR